MVILLMGCASKHLAVEVAEEAVAGSEAAVGQGIPVPTRWGQVESHDCEDDEVSVHRDGTLLWVRARGSAPLELLGECEVVLEGPTVTVDYNVAVTMK